MANRNEQRRINGWDERDSKLWAQLHCLPSYGLIAPNDCMISRESVLQILKNHAEHRFGKAHRVTGGTLTVTE